MLLWQEYKEREPSGYQYSQLCDLFRFWRGKLDLSMRQEHRAGEKMFVDYCGQTLPIVDSTTGEIRDAQVFVAVMGASNYTYAETTWSQSLADWTGSHVRTFSYFGAVPHCIVPDILLSGVTKTCRYEPGINATYQEMATHYGTAVIPARVRKPRDKPKVEAGVQFVQRFILAGLRHHTFFSLAEANAAIKIIRRNVALLTSFFSQHQELFEWKEPKAGPIAFPRYLGSSVEQFCDELVRHSGVLMLPGTLYNKEYDCFRIGFGRSNMEECLTKLEQFLEKSKTLK